MTEAGNTHSASRCNRTARVCVAWLIASMLVTLAPSAKEPRLPIARGGSRGAAAPRPPAAAPTSQALAACSGDARRLLYPLDESNLGAWTVALPACDDCSSAPIPLGFSFSLYGDRHSEVFVNNNGNVSFGTALGPFFPAGFPDGRFATVAPFFADADTRENPDPSLPSAVYRRSVDGNGDGAPDTFVATWANVGHYERSFDRRNTFQVAISDGTNPAMGPGNNVCFSYDVLCWSTGDFDGGVRGFGGTPAIVGVNLGDGVRSFQIGRFNEDGSDYDGPSGPPGGVHFLDRRLFCFDTRAAAGNVCPVAVDVAEELEIVLGPSESFARRILFVSPEAGQRTIVTLDDPDGAQAAGLVVTTTPGNPAAIDLSWTPTCGSLGTFSLLLHATDDGATPCTTDVPARIVVTCADDDPCNVDSCDPAAGCLHSGAGCDDADPCTDDSCDATGACVHVFNQAPCDDGNPCTEADRCELGRCTGGPPPGCEDANPCTDDVCDPAQGCVHPPNTDPCDDGNACTTSDRCGGGSCVGGAPSSCDDGNPCTRDFCRPADGCGHANLDAACDDGDRCTTDDRCVDGACAGGAAPACDDGNPCTDDSCDPARGCVHSANSAPCDDGNRCTTEDFCFDGACAGGAPPSCDDGIATTVDRCDPSQGCVHETPAGAVFSTSSFQFLAGFSVGDADVVRSRDPLAPSSLAKIFSLDSRLGLDALDVRADGDLLLSLRAPGGIRHPDGFLQARPEDILLLRIATGVVERFVDWSSVGIAMPNVDAVAELEDGSLAFSTSTLRSVRHAGGTLSLRPQNVYVFDPRTRAIRLLFDGAALGLRDLDGVEVCGGGTVTFSTATDVLVRRVTLRQQNAYALDAGGRPVLRLDGGRIGLKTLDDFALGECAR